MFKTRHTFLDNKVDDALLQIDDYVFERKDRYGKSGGGILVYISKSVQYKRRHDLESDQLEMIFLEILVPNSKSLFLCSAYRPPSAPVSWVECLANELNKIPSSHNPETILCGDFNIDYLKGPPRYWQNALEQFDFTQVIVKPTRITENSCTLIDHIYTNRPENFHEVEVPVLAISDHYPVCVTRRATSMKSVKRHCTIQYRDFKHFNEQAFLLDLAHSDLYLVESIEDPTAALSKFYEIFLAVIHKHAKIKSKRVKNNLRPSWLNTEINDARFKRDQYHKAKDMVNYKIWRNKVTELIRQSKIDYYQSAIVQNQKSGEIWKYIKKLAPKSTRSAPASLVCDGKISNEEKDIANAFNEYFIKLCENLGVTDHNNDHTFNILQEFISTKLDKETQFQLGQIEEFEVFKFLNSLNPNKSAGKDTIGPRLLKLSAPIISKVVTHLINISLKYGVFPDDLKIAKVSPIFKKGDKTDPGNYRPVSVLPTLSKIFEKHVAQQLKHFLNVHNLLHQEQSGFRQFHSCQTALLNLTEKWLSEMDKGNLIGVTFLDFRKAFDLVDHKILLQKLRCYNFDNNSLTWFQSYLDNRYQYVCISNTHSKTRHVTSGVPQGSVLGPILFLLYVNDLPLHVNYTKLEMFADDATMHDSSPNLTPIQDNMCKDIKSIQNWCTENKMKTRIETCRETRQGGRPPFLK